jgi:hypothetical protein
MKFLRAFLRLSIAGREAPRRDRTITVPAPLEAASSRSTVIDWPQHRVPGHTRPIAHRHEQAASQEIRHLPLVSRR